MAANVRLLVLIQAMAILLLTGCKSTQPSRLTTKFPPDKLRDDSRLFADVMLAMHPAIGIYFPRDYYRKTFDKFTQSIRDSMSEKDFRLKLKLLSNELHCGHTEVIYSKQYYKEISKARLNYSPYVFLPVDDKVYMIADLGKHKDSTFRRGVEVTKINGIGVDSMLRYSRQFFSSDGYIETARNHYIQLLFNTYFTALFGRPDTFHVNYLSKGRELSIAYPAYKPKSFPPLVLGPKQDSLFRKFKRAKVEYRFVDENHKVMHMKVTAFANSGYRRAYRKVFRKAKKEGVESIVLDLRNNGGGSLTNTYRLISYFCDTVETQTMATWIKKYPYSNYTSGNWIFKFTRFAFTMIGKKKTVDSIDYFTYTIKPERKNHFDGKVVVLINGGSFSASAMMAAYLRQRRNTKFVGEETGGTMEGCNAGVTPYYVLPNTGLRIRVPAFRVIHDVCPAYTGRGIMPDYVIRYTLEDILAKRDLEMKKALELLPAH